MSARVTLIGKPGCHLCDDARTVVTSVCGDLGVEWVELSVLDDPVLYDEHAERIPVVLVDDRPHDFWRIDPSRLRAALGGPTRSE